MPDHWKFYLAEAVGEKCFNSVNCISGVKGKIKRLMWPSEEILFIYNCFETDIGFWATYEVDFSGALEVP